MHNILWLLFIVIVLAGCVGQKQQYLTRPETLSVVGPYLHQPSGFSFPEKIGDFVRGAIYQYDAQGQNVAVGYNMSDKSKPMIATAYVYPSPSITSIGSSSEVIETARAHLCKQEFDGHKKEIMAAHPSAKLVHQSESPTDTNKHYSLFEFEEVFANIRQPLSSELELACYVNDKWTVKYRITYPKALNVEREIQDLKRAITQLQYGS